MHVCSFYMFVCFPSLWKQEGNQKYLVNNSKQKPYLVFFPAFMSNCTCEFIEGEGDFHPHTHPVNLFGDKGIDDLCF